MRPLVVGTGVAVIVTILLPMVPPAFLDIPGFGALGSVNGKSTRPPIRYVKTERFIRVFGSRNTTYNRECYSWELVRNSPKHCHG